MSDVNTFSPPKQKPPSSNLPATDIPRRRSSTLRWLRFALLFLALLAGSMWALKHFMRLERAVPKVSGTILFGKVTRNTLVREVSGRGPLVPLHITIVTANVGGQVAEVLVQPGVEVQIDTPLIVMTDLIIERNLVEAKRSLTSAEIERDRFQLSLEQQDFSLRSETLQAYATWEDAKADAEIKGQLAKAGVISQREYQLSSQRAERNLQFLELQLARVENSHKTSALQMREKEAAIARAKDVVADRQRDVDALTIKATTSGILQELGPTSGTAERWDVGQRISAGGRVAKITDPKQLKAVIEVTDVQAKEVLQGQSVTVDTRSAQLSARNAQISGRVTRVAPSVRDGRVAVDVELIGELPSGARPDLEVFGIIEIDRVDNALQLTPCPFIPGSNNIVGLFRVTPNRAFAERVTVQLGRISLNTVEILSGLNDGDEVIISDMSRYENVTRVKLPLQ